MVAGVQVAIVLQNHGQPTGLLEDTQPRPLAHPGCQGAIEDLHEDLPHVMANPFIEDLCQKLPVLGAGDGVGRDAISPCAAID